MRILVAGAGGLLGSLLLAISPRRVTRSGDWFDIHLARARLNGTPMVAPSMPPPLRATTPSSTCQARRGQCAGPLKPRGACMTTASGAIACGTGTRRPRTKATRSGVRLGHGYLSVVRWQSPDGRQYHRFGLPRKTPARRRSGDCAGHRALSVVNLRIPMVLGGPTFESMARQVRVFGGGRQWWSWVALDEIALIVDHVLATDRLVGPVSIGNPSPVQASEFVATLARVQGRRPARGVPSFVLRLVLGEMADSLLLSSRRMEPRKHLSTGYTFRYPDLEAALRHQLARGSSAQAQPGALALVGRRS
jgi:hypothetical protein